MTQGFTCLYHSRVIPIITRWILKVKICLNIIDVCNEKKLNQIKVKN
jgi:hypothetical protein